jgi:hypothetical protein
MAVNMNWGAGLPAGIGNAQQATQATAAMRQSPWYAQLVSSWGLDPSKTDTNGNLIDPRTGQSVKLSDQQQQQLIATARDNGVGISDSYSIDANGQISKPDSHMLRNIAIAAGIAGLAMTGLGAAGIGPLAGAFGGGAAAADGGLAAAEGGFGVGGLDAASLGVASGIAPEIGAGAGLASLGADAGLADMLPGAELAPGTSLAGAGGSSMLGTGSKLAGLLKTVGSFGGPNGGVNTGGMADPRGNAYAAQAAALAANRGNAAKINQAGPAADAQAFRNAMRAGIVAKMAPQSLSIDGHALPTLVNPQTSGYAQTMFDSLNARQNAGKAPTEFGLADPTQAELDAQAKAADAAGVGSGLNSKIADITGVLGQGARLANLGTGLWNTGEQIAGLF